MKKLVLFTFYACLTLSVNAQEKKFKFQKVSRDIKKESKALEREGWSHFPGNAPISMALDKKFKKEFQENSDGEPKYILGDAIGYSDILDLAKTDAIEFAKLALVRQMEQNIASTIDLDQNNKTLSESDARGYKQLLGAATNSVVKKLGYMPPVFEIYRKKGKIYQVRVVVSYDFDKAKDMLIAEMKAIQAIESHLYKIENKDFLNQFRFLGIIHNSSEKPVEMPSNE
jgi:hypothetical protein